MKVKDILTLRPLRQAAQAGLMLVVTAALTLLATSLIQYLFARRGLCNEAENRARSEMEIAKGQISSVIDQAEAAVRNSAWLAAWGLDYPDSLASVSRKIIQSNPMVVGSTVALVPGYDSARPLFAPYAFRNGDTLSCSSLATEEYDYPSKEWFSIPASTGKDYWSEPYIDTGGGNILMTTYSYPIYDGKGKLAAILTADVSLDWLSSLVDKIELYPNAYSVLLSRTGKIMVSPAETLNMRATVMDYKKNIEDTMTYRKLTEAMLNGETGSTAIKQDKVKSYIYFSPVEKTGWSMSIVVPDKEIYGGIRKVGIAVNALQTIGLLLLILILTLTMRSQLRMRELTKNQDRIEGELQIASDIQMSMVPKVFPAFPERKDLDLAASIVPAKEVGGDLYDYHIRDGKLFFCIGDVSGKGVPAALVMAITRSLFRTSSAQMDSPARIVGAMNESLSENNESNMFVTFFCGAIDLATGHLTYCNAGHNAPLFFRDNISTLPVDANLPLGVMGDFVFTEQEKDLVYDDAICLYTDGVTEAENAVHELFGDDRLIHALRRRGSSQEHLESVMSAVDAFVGDAPHSDDKTLLFIRFLTPSVTFSNQIDEIEKIHAAIDGIGIVKDLDESLTSALNLALEEAATNVIMYAYPPGEKGFITLAYNLDLPDRLEFTLSDQGKPFDPTKVPDADVTLGAEERGIGGLGIFLVRNIMDSIRYERKDGKNILYMTKNI